MYDELSRCKDLLTRFGGHRLAAGLSLPEEKILSLRKKTERKYDNDGRRPDGESCDRHAAFLCVRLPRILCRNFLFWSRLEKEIRNRCLPGESCFFGGGRVIGKHQNVLKLEVEDADHTTMDAIFFGDLETFFSCLSQKYGPDAKDHLLYEEEIRF